jgi:hypothetical protein
VVVEIPSFEVRKLIHQTIQLVFKFGTEFELDLIKREKGNPKFEFLTNFNSMEHVYYRWKVFSLKNGDLPNWWKCQPFVMFEGGSTWIPPKIPFEEVVMFCLGLMLRIYPIKARSSMIRLLQTRLIPMEKATGKNILLNLLKCLIIIGLALKIN